MNEHANPSAGGLRADRTPSTRPGNRARKLGSVALGVTLALGAAACSSSKSSTSTSTTAASQTATTVKGAAFDPSKYAGITATLNGSGSTFQANFDNAAAQALAGALPSIKVNYGGGGSGKGKTDLQAGVVDFAGTDSLVKDADKAKYKGEFLYFPTVVAPITVSVNLSGVKDLKLDGPTLAKIFSTKIKTWNDPAITALNSGATMPADPITVCHRSDASGTTSNFTKFLVAAGGPDWTLGTSDSVDWDPTTQGGSGNAGVAQCVKGKAGSIGYVDYSDAKAQSLTFASIKNKNGEYLQPTLDGASKAAEGATTAADLTYDPVDAPGAGAYPITSPTWILVYANQTDHAKGTALKAFLQLALTDGQQLAASSNFAKLPSSLAEKAVAQLDKIKVP